MEPITMALLGSALAGGLSSAISADQQREAVKEQTKNRQLAQMMLMQAMDKRYNTLYGGSANKDGMTTGDAYQDYLLKYLAQQTQGKELQAVGMNNALQNLTDKETQARYLAQALAANMYNNSEALNTAARQGRRYGTDMGSMLLNNAKQQANQRNYMYNNSRNMTNNNLARIGAGSNLNTGSMGDSLRQQTYGAYNQAMANYGNYMNGLANLQAGMPVNGYNPWAAGLQGAFTGAMKTGTDLLSAYLSAPNAERHFGGSNAGNTTAKKEG